MLNPLRDGLHHLLGVDAQVLPLPSNWRVLSMGTLPSPAALSASLAVVTASSSIFAVPTASSAIFAWVIASSATLPVETALLDSLAPVT